VYIFVLKYIRLFRSTDKDRQVLSAANVYSTKFQSRSSTEYRETSDGIVIVVRILVSAQHYYFIALVPTLV